MDQICVTSFMNEPLHVRLKYHFYLIDQNSGKCVPIKDCPVLLEIFNESGDRALQEYDKCDEATTTG